MRAAFILAAALLASPAASIDRAAADAEFARLSAGFTRGAPAACLERRGEQSFRTVGDRLVFRFGSDLFYVNETRGGCGTATKFDTIVVRAGISRLCSGDFARVVDLRSGMESGNCTLGPFVPYRK